MSSFSKVDYFLQPSRASKLCSHSRCWMILSRIIWNVKPQPSSTIPNFKASLVECSPISFRYVFPPDSFSNSIADEGIQNLYRQLMRASRQWRDIKNRMEQGVAHQQEETIQDGSMAVFCPACPQPGINLPDDWKTRYQPYVIWIWLYS
jgi:hypothetical protein